MNHENKKNTEYTNLLKYAEKTLKDNFWGVGEPSTLSSAELQTLIHELKGHQVELEKENENLRRVLTKLKKTNRETEVPLKYRTKAMNKALRKLRAQAKDLKETKIAMKILVKTREEDKIEIEQNILDNIRELVMPYLEKLKVSGLTPNQRADIATLESNLNDITSGFVHKLTDHYKKLTPTEIQVANFIKLGKTSKEISEILCTSKKTIDIHRYNIRKKLGLHNKNENLRTHLMSFSS